MMPRMQALTEQVQKNFPVCSQQNLPGSEQRFPAGVLDAPLSRSCARGRTPVAWLVQTWTRGLAGPPELNS